MKENKDKRVIVYKKDLIKFIYENAGVGSKKEIKKIVDIFIKGFQINFSIGNILIISGIGKFELVERKGRKGKIPVKKVIRYDENGKVHPKITYESNEYISKDKFNSKFTLSKTLKNFVNLPEKTNYTPEQIEEYFLIE